MGGFGIACSGLFTERDSHNLRIFNGWLLAAAVAFAATTVLIGEKIIGRGFTAWMLALLTSFLALLAMRAYVVFVRAADELLRKIQLEGLAFGFGFGAVFMLGYRLFERLGAPKLDTADPFVVMALFWAVGQYLGMRRYASVE